MSSFKAALPVAHALRAAARPALTTARLAGARPVVYSSTQLSMRFKQTIARSEFAKNPIITYDELKPITEQPSDVGSCLLRV
jgi:hypothetical protein